MSAGIYAGSIGRLFDSVYVYGGGNTAPIWGTKEKTIDGATLWVSEWETCSRLPYRESLSPLKSWVNGITGIIQGMVKVYTIPGQLPGHFKEISYVLIGSSQVNLTFWPLCIHVFQIPFYRLRSSHYDTNSTLSWLWWPVSWTNWETYYGWACINWNWWSNDIFFVRT